MAKKSIPVLSVMEWFSFTLIRDHTARHSRNVLQKFIGGSGFVTHPFVSLSCLEGSLFRTSFHLRRSRQSVTITWLTQQGLTLYTSVMDKQITSCDECLNQKGDYVEKWGTSGTLLVVAFASIKPFLLNCWYFRLIFLFFFLYIVHIHRPYMLT